MATGCLIWSRPMPRVISGSFRTAELRPCRNLPPGKSCPSGSGISPPSDQPNFDYANHFDTQDNTVPRIQLVDYSDEKRLSIVAGNFAGKLFYIHNIGSSKQPLFSPPKDLNTMAMSTYSGNHLWCNFLAPFLYDFTGNGQLDLIMGEGTYASNSIYRLINKGSNGSPMFSEERFTEKIIEGYGREHLTPLGSSIGTMTGNRTSSAASDPVTSTCFSTRAPIPITWFSTIRRLRHLPIISSWAASSSLGCSQRWRSVI